MYVLTIGFVGKSAIRSLASCMPAGAEAARRMDFIIIKIFEL